MVNFKSHSVLLTKKDERGFRRELLLFFEIVALNLTAGYDLAEAWIEGKKSLRGEFRKQLGKVDVNETVLETLARLEDQFCIPRYRFTFSLLRQLYIQGAPLTPAFKSFSRFLRHELERELEAHLRATPTRANLIQIVFFLPPTLALIFLPFLKYLKTFLLHS